MGLTASKPAIAVDRAVHEPHATVNADGSLTKWGTRFEDPELKEIVLRTDANAATPQVEEADMDDSQVSACAAVLAWTSARPQARPAVASTRCGRRSDAVLFACVATAAGGTF